MAATDPPPGWSLYLIFLLRFPSILFFILPLRLFFEDTILFFLPLLTKPSQRIAGPPETSSLPT